MVTDRDEINALRLALADAKRMCDDASRDAAAAEGRRWDERRDEQHRLRNMFSVIRVLARRTSEDVATVEDYCGVLDGRLSSYLAIQAVVAQDWHGGLNLELLLANELLTFDLKEGDHIKLVGPAVILPSRTVVLLALACHEVASAGIASGRLDSAGSSLQISWMVDGDGPERHLLIDWTEISPAQDDAVATPSSWAEWIERAIAHQLGGSIDTTSDGARHTTRIRLPSSALL